MRIDRLSRLTEAQRECLRLVAQGYQYKEIAREIGVTPGAVNERLKAAMRTLEVSSRFEAARLLAAHEGAAAYQPLVDQFSGLPQAAPQRPSAAVRNRSEVGREPEAIDMVQEAQAHFEAAYALPGVGSPRLRLPLPTQERPVNDLSSVQRIGWVLAVSLGSALAVGLLLSFVITGLEALSRVL